MRGKLKPIFLSIVLLRITPADAGKTIKIIHFTFRTWDHPRGCGENREYILHEQRIRGSPPRMRGKQVDTNTKRRAVGITPADAGKTVPAEFGQAGT